MNHKQLKCQCRNKMFPWIAVNNKRISSGRYESITGRSGRILKSAKKILNNEKVGIELPVELFRFRITGHSVPDVSAMVQVSIPVDKTIENRYNGSIVVILAYPSIKGVL